MSTTEQTVTQSSSPDHRFPTRRMDFEEHIKQLPKHYAEDGDVVISHFWAWLSATFPEGEEFFVRSVRHYRGQITDPALKKQVTSFIGQEASHGREHRVLNEHLNDLGFPTARIEQMATKANKFRERIFSAEMNLAATVVAEHFTALLAEKCLEDEALRRQLGHQAMQDIYVWHALEESEHKAVAFDVYRAVGGRDKIRIRTAKMMRYTLPLMAVVFLLQVLLTDKAARRPGALRRGVQRFRKGPLWNKEMWEAIKDFERPDFHPNDRNTDALLAEWRERLFGEQGAMNDRLVGATAA